MDISIQKYNTAKICFTGIKNISKEITHNKDFLPSISVYDTGINDSRIKSLIVEKRERILPQAPVPPEYTYTDKYGVTRLKPHLFIKHIVVKPEFLRQGACKKAEEEIVNLSRKEGFEGRVLLDSAPIKGTESYIPNPTIAHWASGFRFYGINAAKQMLEVTNGTRSIKDAPGGIMYYPII